MDYYAAYTLIQYDTVHYNVTINRNREDTPLLQKSPEYRSNVCIPQRYVLTIMGFLGVANAYIMRACLSIAITKMVTQNTTSSSADKIVNTEECPVSKPSRVNDTSGSGYHVGDFDWDQTTQGFILAAFYWGYIITHIPGGMLAQRFGGKHTLGLGILSTAIFTILTPYAAYKGVWPLITLRFLMGLGEGTTFPALSTLLAQWAPPFERSRMAAFVFAGVQIGTVISTALSGIILEYGSWPDVFYLYGVIGLVWFVVWCAICYNDPFSHPFISEDEKEYLQLAIGQLEQKKDLDTPWSKILTSVPVWALLIAEVGHDWGLYTMVTDLPKYMSDVMHFNFAENGILSAIPYLVMWFVSICSGVLADWVLANRLMGVTALRKVLATIGGVGPAVGVVLASYAGCDKTLVSVLFAVGMGLMGFFYASLRVNALDLSPNFSGTIMALVNGSGALSGMVTPTLVGLLTENKTLSEWRVVFWIMALVLIATNFVYVLFGSGELQPWNEPKPKPDAEANDSAHTSRNGAITNNSSHLNQEPTKNGTSENGMKNLTIMQIANSGD